MESKHADRLMRQGILRVGTLYDYRQDEKYGTARGDKDEGVISTYSADTMELWRRETIPDFLRKHIKGKGKYWKIKGIEFSETKTSPDYYVFCVSEEYNHNLMIEFNCDSCIQIDDPVGFFSLITGSNSIAIHSSLNCNTIKGIFTYIRDLQRLSL